MSAASNAGPKTALPPHEYAQRMNRVLDYVDAHLDTELELSTLAEVAHFSPFHFHRMFAAWMGETLGDYVRRRRLEQAAWLLSWRAELSVLHVALSVGFGSGEAFSRAFKAHFGQTPTAWRAASRVRHTKDSNRDQPDRKFDQVFIRCKRDDLGSATPFLESLLMNVTLIDLPPTRIAYLRHIGPYGESVGRFWGTFHQARVGQGFSGNMYGIGLDDPAIAPPDKCRYDACVEVAPETKVNAPFSVTTLPGGRYAALEYQGDSRQIGSAWAMMFGQWLPTSGMQCDARPAFEWYRAHDGFDEKNGSFSCALCIPVAALD
jgi:AraC family transcriptional regulator